MDECFVQVEQLNRDDLIYKRSRNTTNNNTRNFPLVCDFNPSLPTVASYIHKYKYLLEIDENLKKIIDPGKVFVSYRGNKTIKKILVPNKLKINVDIDLNVDIDSKNGCFKCESNCKLWRDFLDCPDKIKSFHTDQEFNFKYALNCKSKNVIYKLDDILCKRTSVGGSNIGMSSRWKNHKSHIYKGLKSCDITCHFASDNCNILRNYSHINVFDEELKKQLCVTIINQLHLKKCR